MPGYCDLVQQIPHNTAMAQQLERACREMGNASGTLASEMLQRFQSPTVSCQFLSWNV